MQVLLSRVSKFGLQYEGDKTVDDAGKQKWYNLSKYEKDLSLTGFANGDTVTLEVNAKGFVTKLEKVSGARRSAQQGQDAAPASSQPRTSNGNMPSRNDADLRITRSSAVKTAFGEPFRVFAALEGQSLEDAENDALALAVRLTEYILNGSTATAIVSDKEEVPF